MCWRSGLRPGSGQSGSVTADGTVQLIFCRGLLEESDRVYCLTGKMHPPTSHVGQLNDTHPVCWQHSGVVMNGTLDLQGYLLVVSVSSAGSVVAIHSVTCKALNALMRGIVHKETAVAHKKTTNMLRSVARQLPDPNTTTEPLCG